MRHSRVENMHASSPELRILKDEETRKYANRPRRRKYFHKYREGQSENLPNYKQAP